MLNREIKVTAVLLVILVSSCGGRTTSPLDGSQQVATAPSWSMPAGNPANTRLSPITGPSSPELQWATLSEFGVSSPAVVLPDGTVVVGAGLAVVAFNQDGTVLWRRPAMKSVRKIHTNGTGMVAYNFDTYTVHMISPDGELVKEFGDLESGSNFLGFDADGTIYTWVNRLGSENDEVVVFSATGDEFWRVGSGLVNSNARLLPSGRLVLREDSSTLILIDKLGQEQWRVTPANWNLRSFFEAENGNIYWSGYETPEVIAKGFQIYSPTGELLEAHTEEFTPGGLNSYQMAGVTSGGNPVWINTWEGNLWVMDSSGEALWTYEAGMKIERVSFGPNNETYVVFLVDTLENYHYNLLGFDASGEIIVSLVYEGNSPVAPVVDQLGRLCFGNHEGFFAYNHDTEMEWGYDFGGTYSSIAIGGNSTVYATAGNVLYATSPAGIEAWRYSAGDPLGVVIVGPNGNIFTHTSNAILELTSSGVLYNYVSLEEEGSLGLSMGPEGHLYAAGSTGMVYAFMPGMIPSWEYQAPGAVTTRMAVGDDGALYFGCNDGKLYALDIAGQPRWNFDMLSNSLHTPVVVGNSVYATSFEGGLFKLALDGTQTWRFQTEDYIYTSPSVGPDGTVYFGTSDYLPAVPSAPVPPPVSIGTPPPSQTSQFGIEADSDPVLLDLKGSGKGLYAVSALGTLEWNLHANFTINDEVAVDAAGNIYLGINGQLFSLYPDGSERWRHRNYFRFNLPPVIGGDGSILLGTANMLLSIGGSN